ncbi:MAG: restriction endonuclease subunit S [Methanoculleus marisnigri]|nr:restriction endonuclease subunit S [Methanoculleus marisnigri]
MNLAGKKIRLGDYISHQKGYAFKSSEYLPSGHPIIRVSNFTDRSIDLNCCNYIDPSKSEIYKSFILREDDVVIATVGSWPQNQSSVVGKVICVPKEAHNVLLNQNAVILRSKPGLDQKYLFYCLKSQEFQKYIVGTARGSANQASITLEAIKNYQLVLPPLPEQHAIARILGTLDNKIELNRKMNATLEAMAQAIFKSWFVDFDPVRAKMEGREPAGMDAETAALFPDGFEVVDGREVPVGWRVVPLPEAIEINPRISLRKGDSAPYLDMKNMPMQGHRAIEWVERPFGSGVKFENGDTLLARITPCLENGKTAYVDFLNDGQVGWGSTEYIVLRPKPPLPKEYGYYLARSEIFRTYTIQNMSGTSGRQRAAASCFDNYPVVVPSSAVAKQFEKIVKSIMLLIKQKDEESRTLTALRDTLLPKLISGEIRMPADNTNQEEGITV